MESLAIVSTRVLIADHDADFLDVTAYALSRAGFDVSKASNGEAALEVSRAENPDIVLLDVAMPDRSGIQVCEAIRSASTTPVVLLSSRPEEGDIIRGFEAGADDYVIKPFSVRHLVLRLRAILQRVTSQAAAVTPRRLVSGPLLIDLDAFVVQLETRPVQLTRLELHILYYLAANADRVVSTSRLIDFAWGLDGEADASLLKTHISHIRRKLREVSDWPITIRACPGLGYSLHIGPLQNASN